MCLVITRAEILPKGNEGGFSRATCNVCRVLEMRLRRVESFQNKRVLGTAFVVQRLKSCKISRKFSGVERSRLSNYGVMNNSVVPDIVIGGYCAQDLNGKQNHRNPDPPDCSSCPGHQKQTTAEQPPDATYHVWRLVLSYGHRVRLPGEHRRVVIHVFHSDAQD